MRPVIQAILLSAMFLAPARIQATPASEARLSQRLDELRRSPGLRQGVTGIYVVEAVSGRPIYARNASRPLNPASNVKLVATAAILDILGPSWRYPTRIRGPRPGARGEVVGDLWVTGKSDPTLRTRHLRRLARRLALAGVRRIRGDIFIEPSALARRVWPYRVAINVIAADRVGAPPRVTVTPSGAGTRLTVAARVTSRPHQEVRIELDVSRSREGRPVTISVSGDLPRGGRVEHHYAIWHRGLATARAMASGLRDAGIEHEGRIRLAGRDRPAHGGRPPVLASHRSISMDRLVARINKRSDNRLADHVVRTAGQVLLGGRGAPNPGIHAMQHYLQHRAGIAPTQVVLENGSGLSRKTRLTARQVVRVLRIAAGFTSPVTLPRPWHPRALRVGISGRLAPIHHVFRRSLAVPGQRGTLQFRFRRSPVKHRLQAKTGTLRDVIALSGLLRRPGRPTLAFAILSGGHHPSLMYLVRRRHEQLVEALDEYLAGPL